MGNDTLGTKLNFGYPDYPLSDGDDGLMARTCRLLEQGEITACQWLPNGSNHVFLVTIIKQGETIKAIYKPRRAETPLWDFPDGTLYKREYGSFLLSQALEWFLVPPTIVRSGPEGIGSMQWFINTKDGVDYWALKTRYLSALQQVALFDYLVNNADRKAGHCLEGQDGRLWIVDHGLTFNAVLKLRTVIGDFPGQPIPDELVADVIALRQKLKEIKPFRETLFRLLDAVEFDALEKRIRNIIDNPAFSYLESRRSMPWPGWREYY